MPPKFELGLLPPAKNSVTFGVPLVMIMLLVPAAAGVEAGDCGAKTTQVENAGGSPRCRGDDRRGGRQRTRGADDQRTVQDVGAAAVTICGIANVVVPPPVMFNVPPAPLIDAAKRGGAC